MFFFREFGKFLVGRSTSFQVFATCILGSVMGFIPLPEGLLNLMLLIALVVILNTHLFLVGLIFGISKLLALTLQDPISTLGESLVLGPLEEIVRWLIHAPVTAWVGFEYYELIGGIPIALILGIFEGLIFVFLLNRFRKWAAKPESSEKLKPDTWHRAFTWFIFGGPVDAETISDRLTYKKWKPIRWWGVILVTISGITLVVILGYKNPTFLTEGSQWALIKINRATVDLDSISYNWKNGRLSLDRLQIADPNSLDENVLEIQQLQFDVDTKALLSRNLVIDSIVVSGFGIGMTRGLPGETIGDPLPQPDFSIESVDAFIEFLEKYANNLEVWETRITTIKRWYRRAEYVRQRMKLLDPEEAIWRGIKNSKSKEEKKQPRRKADHLFKPSAKFLLRNLQIQGITLDGIPEEILHLHLTGLSDRPELTNTASGLKITNEAENMGLQLSLDAHTLDPQSNQILLYYDNLPVDWIVDQLKSSPYFPLRGGELSLEIDGSFDVAQLNLPIKLSLTNSTLSIPEIGETQLEAIDAFNILSLQGSLSAPEVKVDSDAIKQSLANITKTALSQFAAKSARELAGEDALQAFAGIFKDTGLDQWLHWMDDAKQIEQKMLFDGDWYFPKVLTGLELGLGHDSIRLTSPSKGFYCWGRNREPLTYKAQSSSNQLTITVRWGGTTESYQFNREGDRQTFQHVENENRQDEWKSSGEFEANGNRITLFYD